MANRITYGYCPTKWRRWPTVSLAMAPSPGKGEPEELPTPAQQPETTPETEVAPEPFMDNDLPPALPQEPSATEDFEEPSESPLTPPPFGQTPGADGQTPAGDQPPTPPFGDAIPGLPSSQAPSADGQPTEPAAPTQPSPDFFSTPDAPPTMPDDDPFKDDPEPPSGAADPNSGTSTNMPSPAQVASRPVLIPALAGTRQAFESRPLERQTSGTQLSETQLSEARPAAFDGERPAREEPRLLSDPGESSNPAVLPSSETVRGNPLRPSASVIRQTSTAPPPQRPARSIAASQPDQREWRRNPLRAK